jgi:hypothetical protein
MGRESHGSRDSGGSTGTALDTASVVRRPHAQDHMGSWELESEASSWIGLVVCLLFWTCFRG